jgi:S-adenosylmethionine decarboxylase proenzyme
VAEFAGTHLLLRYEDCSADLDDLERVESALREAIAASGATVRALATTRFEPEGLSIVFVLAESHATIHTYPRLRSAFIDIFTCGTRCRPERFNEVLRERLGPRSVRVESVRR